MVPAILGNELLEGVFTLINIEEQTSECVGRSILAVPTLIILNNHEREISRKIGFMDGDAVLSWLLEFGLL